MSEYIKRADAEKAILECPISGMLDLINLQTAITNIDAIPSADVVEVVRCRDCKWYDWVDCNNPIVTAFPNSVRDEDNYCNFGERKEQENERSRDI